METIRTTKSKTTSRICSVIYEVLYEIEKENEILKKVTRYLRVWYKLKRAKRRAHMDFLNPVPLQQIYGIQYENKNTIMFYLFNM